MFSVVYKYNYIGELVSFNSSFDELTKYSKLYINKSKEFYNVFESMVNLKEIKYEDLKKYKETIIIYHSK